MKKRFFWSTVTLNINPSILFSRSDEVGEIISLAISSTKLVSYHGKWIQQKHSDVSFFLHQLLIGHVISGANYTGWGRYTHLSTVTSQRRLMSTSLFLQLQMFYCGKEDTDFHNGH